MGDCFGQLHLRGQKIVSNAGNGSTESASIMAASEAFPVFVVEGCE